MDPVIQQLVANLFSRFAGDGTLPASGEVLAAPAGRAEPEYRSGVQVRHGDDRADAACRGGRGAGRTVVVADGNRIVRVDASGTVTSIAGSVANGNLDGTSQGALFDGPRGIAVAPDGTIYVSDTKNHRIRVIRPAPSPRSRAGWPAPTRRDSPMGGAARRASGGPMGIAIEPNGNLLVAIPGTCGCARSRGGLVSTWAGNGQRVAGRPGRLRQLVLSDGRRGAPGRRCAHLRARHRRHAPVGARRGTPFRSSRPALRRRVDDGPVSVATVFHTVALATRRSDGQVVLADGASARVRALLNGRVDTLAGGGARSRRTGPASRWGSDRARRGGGAGRKRLRGGREGARARHVTGL